MITAKGEKRRPVRRPIELPKEWGITALSVWATCFVSAMIEERDRTLFNGNTSASDSDYET